MITYNMPIKLMTCRADRGFVKVILIEIRFTRAFLVRKKLSKLELILSIHKNIIFFKPVLTIQSSSVYWFSA